MNMSSDACFKIQTQLCSVIDYLKPWLPLVNCHMVNFISGNLWERHVPIKIQEEAKCIGLSGMYSLFSSCAKDNGLANSTEGVPAEEFANKSPYMMKYFMEAKQVTLSSMKGLVLSLPELRERMSAWGCHKHDSLKLKEFMSQKKTHEVELMSEVVAALTTCCNTSHVVDVGGGKGYLSSILALHHGLQVLGLDSSVLNTHGAAKRTEKLKKVWNGLCRRADEIKKGQTPQRRGKHWKSKKLSNDSDPSKDNPQGNTSNDEYKQATVYVTADTCIESLIDEHFPNTECCGVILAGLHTCGNLAPSCLQLFVRSKSIKSLCNVGCCYHLLEEKFSQNPFASNKNVVCESELEYGFPMSKFLTSQNFSLGRNARMLAAQALDRISEKEQVPVEALFYRALLQVILIQKYERESPDWQVGRLANKCKDFPEYVTKALKKLELNIELTVPEIRAFHESYLHRQQELEMFFILRVVLAPIIEAVILLDRLLYLHEQGISEAYLAQMFDPVVSPRCYGLIAVKSQHLIHS
ncbi:probable methyltransferase-like protein 25 isoform X2 [Anabrus simplex]|uniref:probable methyltransferase-like protein 25 isoform X2 n=1 Tax=Anabrus simplex TaxID=316456 RepID=UPI0035A2E647